MWGTAVSHKTPSRQLRNKQLKSLMALDGTKTHITITSQNIVGKMGATDTSHPYTPTATTAITDGISVRAIWQGNSSKAKGGSALIATTVIENQKSLLDEKINVVGIIHSDPFIPLEVPQHIVSPEINKKKL